MSTACKSVSTSPRAAEFIDKERPMLIGAPGFRLSQGRHRRLSTRRPGRL